MNAPRGAGPAPGKRSKRNRAPAPGAGIGEVSPRLRGILLARPVRREEGLKWEKGPDGIVTVTHPKDLGRVERWMLRKFGGSLMIRRRLDAPGSDIWLLCDGKHAVAEICTELDRKYKERIEPVLTRVVKFLEMLLSRNLISLEPGTDGRKGKEAPPAGDPAKGGAKVGTDGDGMDGGPP